MKKHVFFVIIAVLSTLCSIAKAAKNDTVKYFKANDRHIKYIGRIDFKDALKPRFWVPGAYVQAKFKGTSLVIFVNDEELYGKDHNYLEVVVDNNKPQRIKTTGKYNKIEVASNLAPGEHTVTICKSTESSIGYIEFLGMQCEKLLPVSEPKRKIEYIGDSITCGMGIDESQVKCGKGEWYDQTNAYMSYGAIVARELNAQYHITAFSGIGMIHSCCGLKLLMPEVYDKVNLLADTLHWDFSKYTPDVVTICLGQNDGKQDSVAFCSAYVAFVKRIRTYYPKADIVCLNSPMGNAELTTVLKKYITGIQQYLNNHGDKKVSHYFFSGGYNAGCASHPSMAEHQLIAEQLYGYIKQLKNW